MGDTTVIGEDRGKELDGGLRLSRLSRFSGLSVMVFGGDGSRRGSQAVEGVSRLGKRVDSEEVLVQREGKETQGQPAGIGRAI